MQEHKIVEIVQTKIYAIRNQKVMLDSDIAEIYGVETKRINEAVRNNPEKFPTDFVFELNEEEQEFLRSKISTLKTGRGKHKSKGFPPFEKGGQGGFRRLSTRKIPLDPPFPKGEVSFSYTG